MPARRVETNALYRLESGRPNLLMQLAAPHQASSDTGRLQRRAFGR